MGNELAQVEALINTLQTVVVAMKNGTLGDDVLQDVELTVAGINEILYGSKKLKFQKEYNFDKQDEYLAYAGEIEALLQIWKQSVSRRSGTVVEEKFWELYEYIKYIDADMLYKEMISSLEKQPEAIQLEFLSLKNRYPELKGTIDVCKKDYSLLKEYSVMLSEYADSYLWVFEHLEDFRSKILLNGIVEFWLKLDVQALQKLTENAFFEGYDLDIIASGNGDIREVDVKGEEVAVIEGAKAYIQEAKPQLLVSLFYKPEHLFMMAELLYNLRNDYMFYLRYYENEGIWPWNIILYAI